MEATSAACFLTSFLLLVCGCLGNLQFLMVGDWGGQDDPPYYTDAQLNVAQQMGVVASDIGAQFIVSLGDNFYDEGVKDSNDIRFQETFEVLAKK